VSEVRVWVSSPKNSENAVINYSPSCRSSSEHKLRYFFINSKSFQGPEDIVKIVHVTTVVQP